MIISANTPADKRSKSTPKIWKLGKWIPKMCIRDSPYLDYDRLEKVGKLLPDYPIVLHGASTVIPEFVEQCNAYGGKVLGLSLIHI